ncbi:hypothetical protein [Eubacterium ramulus]
MASEKLPLYNYIIFNHVVLFVYIFAQRKQGNRIWKIEKEWGKKHKYRLFEKRMKTEKFGTGIAINKHEKEIRKYKRVSIYETYKEEM